MVFSFMVSVQNKSMRIPFQTAFEFYGNQTEKAYTHGIPIDKSFPEDAANRVGTSDFKSAHAFLCHI